MPGALAPRRKALLNAAVGDGPALNAQRVSILCCARIAEVVGTRGNPWQFKSCADNVSGNEVREFEIDDVYERMYESVVAVLAGTGVTHTARTSITPLKYTVNKVC